MNPKNQKSFKEVLNNSSNLYSIFGILNAFLIFGLELSESEIIRDFVLPFVFLLSILVFYEIMTSESDLKINDLKISLYFISLLLIQIGLVLYFLEFYQIWAKILFLMIFWLGLFAKSYKYIIFKVIKISRRYDQKFLRHPLITTVILFVTLISPLLILYYLDQILELGFF